MALASGDSQSSGKDSPVERQWRSNRVRAVIESNSYITEDRRRGIALVCAGLGSQYFTQLILLVIRPP